MRMIGKRFPVGAFYKRHISKDDRTTPYARERNLSNVPFVERSATPPPIPTDTHTASANSAASNERPTDAANHAPPPRPKTNIRP